MLGLYWHSDFEKSVFCLAQDIEHLIVDFAVVVVRKLLVTRGKCSVEGSACLVEVQSFRVVLLLYDEEFLLHTETELH